jgi:hypothetical protein
MASGAGAGSAAASVNWVKVAFADRLGLAEALVTLEGLPSVGGLAHRALGMFTLDAFPLRSLQLRPIPKTPGSQDVADRAAFDDALREEEPLPNALQLPSDRVKAGTWLRLDVIDVTPPPQGGEFMPCRGRRSVFSLFALLAGFHHLRPPLPPPHFISYRCATSLRSFCLISGQCHGLCGCHFRGGGPHCAPKYVT